MAIPSHNRSADESVEQARNALHAAERYSFKAPLQWLFVLLVLGFGFKIKPLEYLTAEEGLGYALGIIGGVMMLLLLFYPVRKKMKVGRFMGSVPFWFKFHMFSGIFGPIAILYHSNYSMGSFNSSVALICMIIVASSGLFGRYFYSKIHYGLYGRKASVDELSQIIDSEEHELASVYNLMPEVTETLKSYQAESNKVLSFGGSVRRFIVLGFKLRVLSFTLPFKLRKILNEQAHKANWDEKHTAKAYNVLKGHVKSFLNALIRTCEFSIYERLFSLWHILHYPLFIMLVISGIVHVFAVHMY